MKFNLSFKMLPPSLRVKKMIIIKMHYETNLHFHFTAVDLSTGIS